MQTPLTQHKALQLPEIRRCICKFVTVTDAISCVRVCKDWSEDFAFPIWYKVNFEVHKTFENLSPGAISKYGHNIRIIENLNTQSQLNAILHPGINCVRELRINCTRSVRFRTLCMDFIHKNNSTLVDLAMEMDSDLHKGDISFRMISVYPLISQSSVSRLSSIRLTHVSLSRDSFVSLLRGCPFLTVVDLQEDVVLFSGSSIDTFQHPKVISLTAPISQVFKPDPESASLALGSSLLIHFPNLIYWVTYNQMATLVVPIEQIKAETRKFCPKLTDIDAWTTSSSILYRFLADAFRDLRSVTFAYKEFSRDILLALLLHRTTLIEISAFWNCEKYMTERDEVPYENDHFQDGRVVQLLLSSCPKLEELALERHQMDMDHVEESEWACKQLRNLRVRIQGLDTEEKIDRTLQLWLKERRKKNGMDEMDSEKEKEKVEKVANESATSQVNKEDTSQVSIEERVARHLLKFEELKKVWLGTRTCYAP